MSTPRFKKDKEIIAEYESQVKGEGGEFTDVFSEDYPQLGGQANGVHHSLGMILKKLANPAPFPRCGLQPHLCIEFQYQYTLDLWNYFQINGCYISIYMGFCGLVVNVTSRLT